MPKPAGLVILFNPDALIVNCAGCGQDLPCGTVTSPVPWTQRIKGRPYCQDCLEVDSLLKVSPFYDRTSSRSSGQAAKLGVSRG